MSELLKALDREGARYSNSILPIQDFSRKEPFDLLGTGFLATIDGQGYLVSALHNFKQRAKQNASVQIRGQRYALGQRPFYFNENDDLGFFVLDKELESATAGIDKIAIGRDLGLLENGASYVVVLGFPTNFRPAGAVTGLPISTRLEFRDIDTITEIPDALLYRLENEELCSTDGNGRVYNLDPSGMSGGPAIACIELGSPASPRLFCALQSVLVQWHEADGYLVGSATARLVALIDSYHQGTAHCM